MNNLKKLQSREIFERSQGKKLMNILNQLDENGKYPSERPKHIIDYEIVRPYKNGVTPGYINISISGDSLNAKFLQELLTRHYGKDFSTDNSIDIVPYMVIDTGGDEIVAFHFYDDRGFYEYFVRKSL